jgi:hypothetical protein
MMRSFWRFKFRVGDGMATTMECAFSVERAEARALGAMRKTFGPSVEIVLIARWKFDPPPRFFAKREGLPLRNAIGSLACHAWLPLALLPPVTILGLVLLSAIVIGPCVIVALERLWEWQERRGIKAQRHKGTGAQGHKVCPACDLPRDAAHDTQCEFYLLNGEDQA